MDRQADAQDFRTLLSVAHRLRTLAQDELCRGDQALYLMAAQALEKRAEWLSVTLPGDDPDDVFDPALHLPVDMTI